MNESVRYCDLCRLPVEVPDFTVQTREDEKQFCCEACLGVYRMLNEGDIIETITVIEFH